MAALCISYVSIVKAQEPGGFTDSYAITQAFLHYPEHFRGVSNSEANEVLQSIRFSEVLRFLKEPASSRTFQHLVQEATHQQDNLVARYGLDQALLEITGSPLDVFISYLDTVAIFLENTSKSWGNVADLSQVSTLENLSEILGKLAEISEGMNRNHWFELITLKIYEKVFEAGEDPRVNKLAPRFVAALGLLPNRIREQLLLKGQIQGPLVENFAAARAFLNSLNNPLVELGMELRQSTVLEMLENVDFSQAFGDSEENFTTLSRFVHREAGAVQTLLGLRLPRVLRIFESINRTWIHQLHKAVSQGRLSRTEANEWIELPIRFFDQAIEKFKTAGQQKELLNAKQKFSLYIEVLFADPTGCNLILSDQVRLN